MSQTIYDTLIVGQGLAGSALAWALIGAGQRVCVIDDGHKSASSIVAAGLVNPLAGLRFNRRPELDDWLRTADAWYGELQARFGRRFFHPLPMLRLFRSDEQQRFHARLLPDPANAPLLGPAFTADRCPEPIAAPFGGFLQQRTGYVDLPRLLSTLRDWLNARGALRVQALAADELELHHGRVAVAGLAAHRLVFCDGARLRDNPWFRELPLRPEKGEILNLTVAGWQPRHIINGAHWLVPLIDGGVRLGATHDHRRIDDRPTPQGLQALLSALERMRPASRPQLHEHLAGIRPGTADRYPLVGRHPAVPQLWVFNGFGARGSLVIPWYAQCLAAHLTTGAPLPDEADIRRWQ